MKRLVPDRFKWSLKWEFSENCQSMITLNPVTQVQADLFRLIWNAVSISVSRSSCILDVLIKRSDVKWGNKFNSWQKTEKKLSTPRSYLLEMLHSAYRDNWGIPSSIHPNKMDGTTCMLMGNRWYGGGEWKRSYMWRTLHNVLLYSMWPFSSFDVAPTAKIGIAIFPMECMFLEWLICSIDSSSVEHFLNGYPVLSVKKHSLYFLCWAKDRFIPRISV